MKMKDASQTEHNQETIAASRLQPVLYQRIISNDQFLSINHYYYTHWRRLQLIPLHEYRRIGHNSHNWITKGYFHEDRDDEL